MIRVLIADDHELIRAGIKFILSEAGDIVVTGEAANGADAVTLARSTAWDVAILDVNMPIRSGIEALKMFQEEWPRKPVLMLSMYPEELYAVRSIEAGASGYLSKGSVAEDLVKAIRHVRIGKKYITPNVAELLALAVGTRKELGLDALSNRELQVLMQIASGRTLVETGEALNLNVRTVSVYRRRILDKLGLGSTSELVRYGVERGLVEKMFDGIDGNQGGR